MKICTEYDKHPPSNWDNLKSLIDDSDLVSLRFTMGVASLMFGVMLMWPGDSFDRPMFSVVRDIIPELSWAWLFTINGIATVYSTFCGLRLRMCFYFGGVLGSILWTSMGLGMLFSSFWHNDSGLTSMPAASAPSLAFMLASWWILYRYPRDLK